MESPTHNFRETDLVFELILEWQIKSKAVMSCSSQKKEEDIFCTIFCILSEGNFFDICVSAWNTLSEYTYFYISKNITPYTILLVFKIIESLQCILQYETVFGRRRSISLKFQYPHSIQVDFYTKWLLSRWWVWTWITVILCFVSHSQWEIKWNEEYNTISKWRCQFPIL